MQDRRPDCGAGDAVSRYVDMQRTSNSGNRVASGRNELLPDFLQILLAEQDFATRREQRLAWVY